MKYFKFYFYLVCFILTSWEIIHAAPAAPTLSSPSNYAVMLNQTPYTFSWSAVSGAVRYRILVDNASGFGSPEIYSAELSTTQYSHSSSLPNNVYYWTVQAKDSAGQWSAVGATSRTFILDTPPPAPTLSSPSSGSTFNQGSSIAFSWSGPSGNSINRYRLRVVKGTNINDDSQVKYDSEFNSTSKTLSASGWGPGSYTWMVKSIKNVPNVSGFSQLPYEVAIGWGTPVYDTFTMDKPAPPSLISPLSTVPVGSSVTFQWNTSTGANRYRLKVCTDQAMSQIMGGSPIELPAGQTSYTMTSGNFSACRTYYWQVSAIAVDETAGWGVYGPTPPGSFTVSRPLPPSPIEPLSTVPIGSPVQFRWGTSTGANRYRMKVCTDQAMTQFVGGTPKEFPVGPTNCTIDASYFTAGKTYYWQVGAIATDESTGWGDYGPTPPASFTVDKPSPPTLIAPLTSVAIGVPVQFRWNTSTGAYRYRLKVCSDQAMSQIVGGVPCEPQPGQTTCTMDADNFSAGRTYYWQVGAITSDESTGWGNYGPTPPGSFTVDKPAPPDLISPQGNVQAGSPVEFKWGTSSGANRYRLKVCTDQAMSQIVGGNPIEPPVGQASWTIPAATFTTGQTYYWQVGAIAADESAGWGVYGPATPWAITAVEQAGTPVLQSPANGGTVTGSVITFDWSDVYGSVDHYEIIVDNNTGLGSPELHEPGYHFTVQDMKQSTCQITNWLPNNTYSWKIIAHFTNGTTAESPTWTFTYAPADASMPVWVPLYRFYKGEDKDHFYTTLTSQGVAALSQGYTFERVECYVSDRKFSGGIPLMRLYSPSDTSHLYTTDESEKDTKIALSGYVYEGIQGWVYASSGTGAIPLHRLRQTAMPNHYFLCSRDTEYDTVLGKPEWKYIADGITGYVYPDGLKETIAHSRPQGNFGGADMATRAFRKAHANPDLSLEGVGPDMVFKHTYNSFSFSRVPLGPGWTHSFYSYIMETIDGDHRMVIVRWGDGTETSFTTSDGVTYTPEPGSYETLTPISDLMNEGYDITTKDQTVYSFRKYSTNTINPIPDIYLMRIKDRNGNLLTLNWEVSHGLLDEVRSSNGHIFTFAYNNPNNPTLLTQVSENALGRSVSFGYDDAGRLASYTDAKGYVTQYGYDDYDRLTSITRPKGNIYRVGYTTDGKVSSLRVGTNPATTILPGQNTGEVVVTTPEQKSLTFQTSNYLLKKLIDGQSQPMDIEYADTANPTLPTKVTERPGTAGVRAVTQYEYDTTGNIRKVTNARGFVADYTYDGKNNIKTSSDFHVIGQTGHIMEYTYFSEATGNLKEIIKPDGSVTHFTYDGQGLVQSSMDGLGNITWYTYDAFGNLETLTDPLGNVTLYSKDAAGRIGFIRNAERESTVYGYDHNDNLNSVTNNSGFPVNISFDTNNNLSQVHWYNGSRTGNTDYGYDPLDRLETVTDPLRRSSTYTYNTDDTLATATDRNDATVRYTYDGNTLLKSVQYPDHTRIITRYDNGKLHTISSANGTTSFEYTLTGQVSKVTDPYGNVVQYTYDERNNLSRIAYPGGKNVDYGYDDLNRLHTVKDWANATPTTYTYDLAGNLKLVSRPNGTEAAYTYDPASRLISVLERKTDGTVICSYTYTLDKVGRHKSVQAEVPIAAAIPAQSSEYAYDVGNQLVSSSTATYTYDLNGNRISSTEGTATTTYAWDYENMLKGITSPGTTVSYRYDGQNNRIGKTVNGTGTRYVLDLSGGMSRVLAETDGSGNVTAYYVYGLGLVSRITADSSPAQSFYHFNNRGDTIALTNAAGSVTDSYFYDEYGRVLASSGSTPNPFRFVGMSGVMEDGNNLYFMRARYYDVSVDRFLSEDPLGFQGGDWNMYGYVGGDPVTGIDPSGLSENKTIGSRIMNWAIDWEGEAYATGKEIISNQWIADKGGDLILRLNKGKSYDELMLDLEIYQIYAESTVQFADRSFEVLSFIDSIKGLAKNKKFLFDKKYAAKWAKKASWGSVLKKSLNITTDAASSLKFLSDLTK